MGYAKEQRPVAEKRGHRKGGQRLSTAASTALDPVGHIALETTSTGAPVVYTLGRAPKPGLEFFITAQAIASSSVAPIHLNAAAGSWFGSTAEDMLILAQAGAGAHIVGFSTSRWHVVGLSQPDSSGNFAAST